MASLALKWLLVLTLALWSPIQCCCSIAAAMSVVGEVCGIEASVCPGGGPLLASSGGTGQNVEGVSGGAAIRTCCAARFAGATVDSVAEFHDANGPSQPRPCSCDDRELITALVNSSSGGLLTTTRLDFGGCEFIPLVRMAHIFGAGHPATSIRRAGPDPPGGPCTLVHQRVKLLI